MFSYIENQLASLEATVNEKSFSDVLPDLRRLGLDDFGSIMFEMPNPNFPKLSSIVPKMASAEVQNSWTGNNGFELLKQTCNFVRSASYNYNRLTGHSLDQTYIMDFGCGYGRIFRLMYYFSNPNRIFGVDPWPRSIELCREAGLEGNFSISSYLPNDLPVGEELFNFVYAFSVFTHLSENATLLALKAIRKYTADDGILLITIRPIEYWDLPSTVHGLHNTSHYKKLHSGSGFAFSPHDRETFEGEITYGDTSLSLEWLGQKVPEWRIAGVDRTLDDPYQIYVFLRPV